MRYTLPAALLLFGAANVHAQPQTSGSSVDSTVPVPSPSAPARLLPAPAPAFVLPERSTTMPQPSARAEVVASADEAAAPVVQERRRSRLVWFLVGAVVVLGILVAAQ